MSCQNNTRRVAGQAAKANGISENSSKNASLAAIANGKSEFNLVTLSKLMGQLSTAVSGEAQNGAVTPQSKWTQLDRMYRLSNPAATEDNLQEFQVWRRKLVASNVKRFHQAIRQQKKVSLYYQSADKVRKVNGIPLDVRGGTLPGNKHDRYLVAYIEKTRLRTPFRVDRVLKVENTDEPFDPHEARQAAGVRSSDKEFVLPRDWSRKIKETKGSSHPDKDKRPATPITTISVNLKGRDLSGQDLKGVNLSKSDLSGANLQNTDLSGADLSGADLSNANLSSTRLSSANLIGVNLQKSNLTSANLDGANLKGANLGNSDMTECIALNADFSKGDLHGANLTTAIIRSANLSGANLKGANLWGADLSGATLKGAGLQGSDIQYATLTSANLSGANLKGANLKGAEITDVNLKGAKTDSANLHEAFNLDKKAWTGVRE